MGMAIVNKAPCGEALETFTLPRELPVTLPSELVRQRPDIRASEALLHQASAEIGVATANLYPKITLSGDFGTSTNQFRNIFAGPSVWSIGAALLQPLFHGGELEAKRRASIAAFDAANAQYRQTVLQARRLVERGVPLVTVFWPNDGIKNVSVYWDTHSRNFIDLKDHLMPVADQAIPNLLVELASAPVPKRADSPATPAAAFTVTGTPVETRSRPGTGECAGCACGRSALSHDLPGPMPLAGLTLAGARTLTPAINCRRLFLFSRSF